MQVPSPQLTVRKRKRKRIAAAERVVRPVATAPNQSWSMDFVADGLAYGRRFRCLNIVDDYTRECLVIEVDTSLPGLRVATVLQRLAEMRGLPRSITVDNGPESKFRRNSCRLIRMKVFYPGLYVGAVLNLGAAQFGCAQTAVVAMHKHNAKPKRRS